MSLTGNYGLGTFACTWLIDKPVSCLQQNAIFNIFDTLDQGFNAILLFKVLLYVLKSVIDRSANSSFVINTRRMLSRINIQRNGPLRRSF